jgi:hypothetical protein
VLFASGRSAHSNRSVETLRPLAEALGVDIDDSFLDEQHKALARHLLHDDEDYADETVLVAWHHEKIPALARDLGIADPAGWPDDVYDRIWEITYDEHGAAALVERPQPAV